MSGMLTPDEESKIYEDIKKELEKLPPGKGEEKK